MYDDEKYDVPDMEKDILNVSELVGTDIKINPDFYIHNALLKAQNCINVNSDLRESYARYVLFIKHIEVLCKAADMVMDDFDNKVKEFIEKNKLTESIEDLVKVANFKLEILMSNIFNAKTITQPIHA